MKRALFMPLMLLALAVIFLAGNQIAGLTLRSWRLDLTEQGLYRLSPGTEEVIGRLTEPVEWRFYYSRAEAAQYPAIRAYASRVREMLEAYADRSGGMIRLTTKRGSIEVMARADRAVAPDMVFLPFAYVEAAANILTNPALDPYGKIPEFKYSAVKVEAADPGQVAAE